MDENKNQEVVETTEELTVFGKLDRKIVETRKAKAAKKAEKAKAKEAKKAEKADASSKDKKKINPKVAIAGGAPALVTLGGVIAKVAIDKSGATAEPEDGAPAEETPTVPEETEPETV